jgi:hypothetical protein
MVCKAKADKKIFHHSLQPFHVSGSKQMQQFCERSNLELVLPADRFISHLSSFIFSKVMEIGVNSVVKTSKETISTMLSAKVPEILEVFLAKSVRKRSLSLRIV